MTDTINPMDLPGSPSDFPLTVSPADTFDDSPEPECEDDDVEIKEEDDKKPTKKRKSWGQELPTPKTNLPPKTTRKSNAASSAYSGIALRPKHPASASVSEMEKLETEKIRMEEQNQFLLSRLTQMEVENNRLSQQVAQLSAEVRGSRSTTPISNKATSPPPAITESPTLTPTLFKQEGEDIQMERIPFPTPATSTLEYSPTLQPSTLAEASDATQHPAAMLCDLQSPLSDDDFRRLFHGDSAAESNPSFPEDGFAFGALDGVSDLSSFPFDSLVDFDPESVGSLDGVNVVDQSTGLSDESACPPASVQPSLGASTSRCDGQSIAASDWVVSDSSVRVHVKANAPDGDEAMDMESPYYHSAVLSPALTNAVSDIQVATSELLSLRTSRDINTTSHSSPYAHSLHSHFPLSPLPPPPHTAIMVRKDPIFEARTNVKLHSNRLKKEAARAESTFKSEKAKADRAMKNREFQIARIHASSAVREKRRQVTLKSEAARADVIINELKAAQSTRDTSRTLALASRGLDAASKSVNLEHLVSHANNFLARSEDFKIASSAIEDVAQGVSLQEYGAEGQHEVDRMMEQLADEAGVDMRIALEQDTEVPNAEVKGKEQAQAQQQPGEVEDGLGARLRALRAAN
ncbi:Snf7 [Penicillium cosmopolitanum]|uniref:Snf7 n=1 Tax=Penicillium cosmopolitanum TaxID=1131564 RepID=A0A9X0B8W6_9EURO|nr:Snf7 [Penicillium cosmopolitanum]KAJ5392408.1 Snf7 [Penicillium cosmopolitanum]